MAEALVFRGTLKGHSGWVTAIATSAETPNTILSSSRGKQYNNIYPFLDHSICIQLHSNVLIVFCIMIRNVLFEFIHNDKKKNNQNKIEFFNKIKGR